MTRQRSAMRGGGAGLALAWWLAAAPVAAETIRDWPCEQPLAERLVAEQVWGGALPAPLPAEWQADVAVREVVALAANPENAPAQGVQAIAALAGRAGGRRQDALLAVEAGLLEAFATQRGFVIEGVRDYVVRAKILQEAVDRSAAALAALPADGGTQVEQQREDYRAARAFDARNLDDALDEAEFLCRRYDYLAKKLGRLTDAVRSALAD